ncbi:twin-arginine translocation pathway signal protein [Nitrospirillum viridazoti]|uniref:Twin-arginine translocation pathway signal protein n=1 Tax=Nitrospirillum viridazoti CBAmc TaxID=1441467 RepID=A0A248JP58_9PROT|nr:twin-arginine translocation pathway signal protein [Nitrospirillum amazonense]ASG20291.1 twin-arginine translocation pathway signal protein [Nitrospirillum amazonense CBAmc]TWB27945.1 hypothetical protein FBZ91_1312 [Nitrospirillum amazonense]
MSDRDSMGRASTDPSRRHLLTIFPIVAAAMASTWAPAAIALTKADLDRDADLALRRLCKASPAADTLSRKARSVLIFPSMLKTAKPGGQMRGEGILKRGTLVEGYYESEASSRQSPVPAYGYVVFLMTAKAETYAYDGKGWEFGIGPTPVVVNEDTAPSPSVDPADDAYAFVFDRHGATVRVGIEGTRIYKTGWQPN